MAGETEARKPSALPTTTSALPTTMKPYSAVWTYKVLIMPNSSGCNSFFL